MSALVCPFPRSRNRRFIQRHAWHMLSATTSVKAETHLRRQLQIQREMLERRGVAPEVITIELAAVEDHIRAACWSLSQAPGGAA